jgi:hypothetical protein
MRRVCTRVFLLSLVVCFSLVATRPASACLLTCSTEGETIWLSDGCCPGLLFGPTERLREYVCHLGCYQVTSTTQCTNQACSS